MRRALRIVGRAVWVAVIVLLVLVAVIQQQRIEQLEETMLFQLGFDKMMLYHLEHHQQAPSPENFRIKPGEKAEV